MQLSETRGRTGDSLTPVARSRASLLALLVAACCLVAPARAQAIAGQAAFDQTDLEHRARLAVDQNLADYLFGQITRHVFVDIHPVPFVGVNSAPPCGI